MRIGIDACTWTNRRGFGRFTRLLVTSLVTEYPQHTFLLVMDQFTANEGTFPPAARLEIVHTREQPTKAASAESSRSLRDLWKMSRAVGRLKLDAFFFPTRYSFYPLFCKTSVVVAFHDATAEQHPKLIFPGWRSRLFWNVKSWLALRQADRLVTVSQDARSQLAATFRRPASSIDLITEGPDPLFRPIIDARVQARPILEKYRLPLDVPLILYVGGISPHKNLGRLLEAVKQIDSSQWHLALIGEYQSDSFWSSYGETVRLAERLGLGDRITFTGYVADEELAVLYNVATLLVLPSLSEGFGLPVVEAMACGLPVAASNRNSLPEILGDAGLLFDPLVPAQIAAAIDRLLSDPALRDRCRVRGLQRAELFSWKTASRKLMEIIEKVVTDAR